MNNTPLIDMHSHWGTEEFYPLRGAEEQAIQMQIWKTECRFYSLAEQADYFRANHVRVILDFGFTQSLAMEQVRRMHDTAIAYQRDHGDVIIGNWLQINPDEGEAALAEINRVADLSPGFVGVACSAVRNRRPPTHESFQPLYRLCAARGLPVMFFVGFTGIGAGKPGGDGIVLEDSHPRHVDAVAAAYPDLRIIAARPAWPWQAEMNAVLMHKGNVFAEFHGASPRRFPPELKVEIPRALRRKVMYANDFPLLHYDKIVSDWREEGYAADVLDDIFTGNAERFLAAAARARRPE